MSSFFQLSFVFAHLFTGRSSIHLNSVGVQESFERFMSS